jgi:phage shock protein A
MIVGSVQFYIALIIVVIVLIVVFFPGFCKRMKVLISGFLGSLTENVASTPDGARAVYNEAIEQQESVYAKSANVLQKLTGKYSSTQKNYETKQKELKSVESECEALVRTHQLEQANVLAEKRTMLLEEVESLQQALVQLKPMVDSARDVYQRNSDRLEKLKRDSVDKVEKLQLDKMVKESQDDIDSLRNDTAIKKLLDSVDKACVDADEMAVGSKELYDNKTSTKVMRAEADARNVSTSSYIDDLMKKYPDKK